MNRPSRYSMYREMFPSFAYHQEIGLKIHELKTFSWFLKEYWSGMIDVRELYGKLEQWLDSAADHERIRNAAAKQR